MYWSLLVECIFADSMWYGKGRFWVVSLVPGCPYPSGAVGVVRWWLVVDGRSSVILFGYLAFSVSVLFPFFFLIRGCFQMLVVRDE